jgi:hypothetical protein
MIITMAAAAHSAPNYLGSGLSAGATLNGGMRMTSIHPSAGIPHSGSFSGSVNGAMQAVFAYGGAMIFLEFISEMRYPRDLLKGCGQRRLSSISSIFYTASSCTAIKVCLCIKSVPQTPSFCCGPQTCQHHIQYFRSSIRYQPNFHWSQPV